MLMATEETFAAWLRRELDAHGINQDTEAARLLGVSHTSIRRWLRGGEVPSNMHTLQQIGKQLGVPGWRVLVAAGWVDPPGDWQEPSISEIPTRVILAEIERRTGHPE